MCLRNIDTLYLPGPGLDTAARLRLRAGVASYSLVGVTHTTAPHSAMDSITGLLTCGFYRYAVIIRYYRHFSNSLVT